MVAKRTPLRLTSSLVSVARKAQSAFHGDIPVISLIANLPSAQNTVRYWSLHLFQNKFAIRRQGAGFDEEGVADEFGCDGYDRSLRLRSIWGVPTDPGLEILLLSTQARTSGSCKAQRSDIWFCWTINWSHTDPRQSCSSSARPSKHLKTPNWDGTDYLGEI